MRTRILTLISLILALMAATTASAGQITVQAGETLSHIALREGTSVAAISRANGIADPHTIYAGQRLSVGGGGKRASSGSSRGGGSGGGGYVVQPGDNLAAIADRYGMSVAAIASANGTSNPHMIMPGTRLRVSGGGGSTSVTRVRSATRRGGNYVVQAGDTLASIAERYGTSAAAIASANGISNPHLVVVGTELSINGSRKASPRTVTMSQGSMEPVTTATTGGWGSQPSRAQVRALMADAAARHGVDAALVRAIGWQESGWWQGARSSTGAIGVMQLMPATSAWLGDSVLGRSINPYDVRDNIDAGTAFLAYLQRQTGSRRLTIASYYQGLGSVQSRGLYGETEVYVSSVATHLGRV